jgi:hypothetical protein
VAHDVSGETHSLATGGTICLRPKDACGWSTQTPGLPLIRASQICCPVHCDVLAHGTGFHSRRADLQPCHRRYSPSSFRGHRSAEDRRRHQAFLRPKPGRSGCLRTEDGGVSRRQLNTTDGPNRLTGLPHAVQSVFVPRSQVGGGSTHVPAFPAPSDEQI